MIFKCYWVVAMTVNDLKCSRQECLIPDLIEKSEVQRLPLS